MTSDSSSTSSRSSSNDEDTNTSTPPPAAPFTPKVLYSRIPDATSGESRTGVKVAVVSPLFKTDSSNASGNHREPRRSVTSSRSSSKYSPYKLDKTRDKSNASMNSNGTLDESFDDRYDQVGYNSSPSTTPVGRDTKPGWYDMHEKHAELAECMNPKIILCGDSIVAGLQRYPRVWNKYFKPRGALNCGIGGDQTQHVLWRMENIALPSTVQYVVVHCGTNNIDRDTPQEIANGAISVGLVLQEYNRKLHVVVTGILPRDYLHNSHRRRKIKEVNRNLKRHCKEFENFTFMRQDSDWTTEDGTLNTSLYYTDHLHLIETGNEKFARSITNTIDKIERNEDVCNSSDEEKSEMKFERKRGERRHDTPRNSDFIIDNPFKLRRSNERKRSLSPCRSDLQQLSSTSQKRLRTESSDDHDGDDRYAPRRKLIRRSEEKVSSSNESRENDRGDTRPRQSVEMKSETPRTRRVSERSSTDSAAPPKLHGGFALSRELKHDAAHEELCNGTAKSIDITQTDAERLAARRAKFNGPPLGGGSLKKLSESTKAEVRGDIHSASHTVSLARQKDIIQSLGE